MQKLGDIRTSIEQLVDKLPANLKATTDVQKLVHIRARRSTVIRLVDSSHGYIGQGSDHEFSRATVNHAWEHGREHIRGLNAMIDDMKPMELGLDLRIYDLDAKTLKREGVKATAAAD